MSTKARQWNAAVAALVLGVAASPIAAAQDNVPNPVTGFSQNRKEPMNIEALKLELRDKQKIATFTGNVVVVQGDTTLKCKVLVVFYDNEVKKGPAGNTIKTTTAGPQGSQQIRRLEAKGDVIVTQKDQVATGNLGIFDTKTNTVTLSGNVTINQGPNVTRGERLVVDLTTGVSRMDAGAGPVRMLIQQRPATIQDKPGEHPKVGPGRMF